MQTNNPSSGARIAHGSGQMDEITCGDFRPVPKVSLDNWLSTYLDALRFVAALGVVMFHAQHLVVPSLPSKISAFGEECVAVFFVLSGFVLRYATQARERRWQDYALARAARVLSVAPLALVVTLLVDAVGRHFDPALYSNLSACNSHTTAWDISAALTFTNEALGRHVIVGCNEPYWSLGFEVMYYAAFGLALFTSGLWRGFALTAWAFLAGFKIVVFLPLWLLGVALYDLMYRWRMSMPRWLAWPSLIGTPIAIYVLRFYGRPHGLSPMFMVTPATAIPSLCYYFVLGVLFALNIAAFRSLSRDWSISKWPAKIVKRTAEITFTLYLYHEPMLIATRALLGRDQPLASGLLVVGVIVLLCTLLAELGERRKNTVRSLILGLLRSRYVAAARARA